MANSNNQQQAVACLDNNSLPKLQEEYLVKLHNNNQQVGYLVSQPLAKVSSVNSLPNNRHQQEVYLASSLLSNSLPQEVVYLDNNSQLLVESLDNSNNNSLSQISLVKLNNLN